MPSLEASHLTFCPSLPQTPRLRAPATLLTPAGFVVDIKGVRTHTVVEQALDAIKHLDHRGAAAADALSGDGVGLTTQGKPLAGGETFMPEASADFKP